MGEDRHQQLQNRICAIAEDLGCSTTQEQAVGSGRTDVLIQGPRHPWAIEIQLSQQSLEEYRTRTKAYRSGDVRILWLTAHAPAGLSDPDPRLRLFVLQEAERAVQVNGSGPKTARLQNYDRLGAQLPLDTFLQMTLQGQLCYAKQMLIPREQTLPVTFFPMYCWSYGVKNMIYDTSGSLRSICGGSVRREVGLPDQDEAGVWEEKMRTYPPVVEDIRAYVKRGGYDYQIGPIKECYSKTMGQSYPSFGCGDCDAIFGDFYVRQEWATSGAYEDSEDVPITLPDRHIVEKPHWCIM